MYIVFLFIYSLAFLVKDEICMVLLPDLCFLCFCAIRMAFPFFHKTFLRSEIQSRETQ